MTNNIVVVHDSATMRECILHGGRRAGIDTAMTTPDGSSGDRVAVRSHDLILTVVGTPHPAGLAFTSPVAPWAPTPPPNDAGARASGNIRIEGD